MAKLLYSAAMSLDGYIAGYGGDMSWLADHLEDDHSERENATASKLLAETGALLVGNNTFGGDDPNRGREGEGKRRKSEDQDDEFGADGAHFFMPTRLCQRDQGWGAGTE